MEFWHILSTAWQSIQSWLSFRVGELSVPIDAPGEINMAWAWVIPLAQAAIGAYSSRKANKEQKKIAEEARKGTTTTQTSIPYMNEYIARLIPYILSEQQKIYESRLKGYGLKPGDFSPIAAMLAGISPSYSGVGTGAGGVLGQGGVSGSGMPGYQSQIDATMNTLSPEQRKELEEYARERGMSVKEAAMEVYGADKGSMGRGALSAGGGDYNPFGSWGFSGVPAGDAAAAGKWAKGALGQLGKGMMGGGLFGNLFGLGEWSASEKKAVK